jgi:hypothetical protein
MAGQRGEAARQGGVMWLITQLSAGIYSCLILLHPPCTCYWLLPQCAFHHNVLVTPHWLQATQRPTLTPSLRTPLRWTRTTGPTSRTSSKRWVLHCRLRGVKIVRQCLLASPVATPAHLIILDKTGLPRITCSSNLMWICSSFRAMLFMLFAIHHAGRGGW